MGFSVVAWAAGVERVNDGGGVLAVGGADIDGVGVYLGEHFFPIGEDIRNAVGFAGPLEAFIAVIDGGDEFDIGEFFECAEVEVGDSAAADDGDAEFFSGVLFLGGGCEGLGGDAGGHGVAFR